MASVMWAAFLLQHLYVIYHSFPCSVKFFDLNNRRVRLLSAHDMQLALAQQLVSDSPTENSLTGT